MKLKTQVVFLSAVFLAVAVGCSSSSSTDTGKVTGHVSFEGKPVTEGAVVFTSTGEGTGGRAEIQSDGSYQLIGSNGGIAPGEYQVAVTPKMITLPATAVGPGGEGFAETKDIPKKYHSPASSGLKCTVTAGAQTFDIPMTAK